MSEQAADEIKKLLSKSEGNENWGEATEGVQVRLRADKTIWKVGEVPAFKADVRNLGQRELLINFANWCCELEWDGQVFDQREQTGQARRFGPAQHYEDLDIALKQPWVNKKTGQPLKFPALGKHTVRVAIICEPSEKGALEPPPQPVRAVSNPIEIEILPADAKPAALPGDLSFGPVVNSMLCEWGLVDTPGGPKNTGDVIHFASGHPDKAPAEVIQAKPGDLLAWARKNKVDARAELARFPQGLAGFDLAAQRLPRDQWEAMTAAQALQAADSLRPADETLMTANMAELPATFLFKTRGGTVGLLQITILGRPKQAVGFRYKLVQAAGVPSAATPPPAPITIGYQSETMQNIIGTLLRRECSARLCLENLDFDMAKDGITIEQAIEQLEGAAKKRKLTPAEQTRLSLALKLLSEGNPETMIFDVGSRHSGQFHADSVDELLTQITRGTPYAWRKIGDTYVVLPAVGSRLAYPVTLNTKGLTVRQAVEKVVEQRPAGSTISMRSAVGMPVKEGEDPMPWLSAQAPALELKGIPALEALCRITEGARPDSVWELAGYKDSRGLGIQRGPNGSAATASIPPAAQPEGELSWGPVIERSMSFDSSTKDEAALDLDTGRYGMHQGGNDLSTAAGESDMRVRIGLDMVAVPVDASRWDSTPAEVREALAGGKVESQVRLGGGESRRTFFFRTREGGTGVLRISPKGGEAGEVTVRYKMLVRAATDIDGTIQALQNAGAKLTLDAKGRPAEIYFGSRATDEHLPLLKGLTHLKRLNLETAKITDAALGNLAGLTELESLSLYQTGVTAAGLAHLTTLPDLEQVSGGKDSAGTVPAPFNSPVLVEGDDPEHVRAVKAGQETPDKSK